MDPEQIAIQDVLDFYKKEVSDKNEQLAIAHAQIKNRDRIIDSLKEGA